MSGRSLTPSSSGGDDRPVDRGGAIGRELGRQPSRMLNPFSASPSSPAELEASQRKKLAYHGNRSGMWSVRGRCSRSWRPASFSRR